MNREELTFNQEEAYGLLREIGKLHKENDELKHRNEFLEKCLRALKLNLSKTTQERNDALDKLHRIQTIGNEEALIDDFIANGEKHYNDTWNITCGDDF